MTGGHCKLKSYLTLLLKMASIFLAAALPVILLGSCPTPVTDDLLIKVQDSFPPTVTISSPADDSYYYSKISITGTVTDNALAANDGKGELALISYTVTNDASRRGKIKFADDGSFTKDTSFGSGDIIYDRKTGNYTIPFSTIEVDGITNILKQRVTVTITATDKNNNSTTKIVRLLENEGPYINLVEPGTDHIYFKAGEAFEISGLIGNSYLDQVNANEITAITWKISNLSLDSALDITEGSSDFNGTIFSTTKTINQSIITFTYTPATRSFFTSFNLPYGDYSLVPVEVSVSDLNSHTSTAAYTVYSNEAGPVMTITLPATTTGIYNDGTVYTLYVNATATEQPDLLLPWVLTDNGPVAAIKYTLPPLITAFTDNANDITSPVKIPGSSISAGELTLTLQVINDSNRASYYSYTIKGDDGDPVITIPTFSSTNSNSTYAKPGDTINLNFTIADAGPANAVSGLPSLTPIVLINGDAATYLSDYSYSYLVPDNGTAESVISLSISGIEDNVGNSATASAPSVIKYYSGSASLTGIGIVSNNTNPNSWAKQGETITLTFTSPRDLITDPVVTIAGNPPDSLSNIGNAYTATYTMTSSDSDNAGLGVNIPYTINFTDAAGNTGTAVSANSGITFDKTAPAQPSVVINDGDGLVNISENSGVSFTISGEAGTTYSITSPNCTPIVSTGTIPVGGVTTGLTLTADSNGSLSLSVVLEDAAGNISSSGGDSSTADITAPNSPPFNGSTTSSPSNDTTPTWNWDSVSGATKYRYSLDSAGWVETGATTEFTQGTALSETTHTFDIQAGDDAGNWSGSTSSPITIDTTAPTLDSISLDDSNLIKSETAIVTFVFSEAVTGFDNSDASANNGTLSSLSTSDNIAFTGTFTPTDNMEDSTNTVTVGDNIYTDLAGNNGTGNSSANYAIDTVAPELTGTAVFTNGGSSGTADAGDTITITYTEPLDPSSIDGSLTAGGNISGTLAALLGKLGTFAAAGDITADAGTLSLSVDGTTVVVTLGGTIAGSTDPSGIFTSIGTIFDIAGNAIDTGVTINSSGTW